MKVIMNPPYSGNLHLKILREAMQHSDDIVNLSPIYWLSYVNKDKTDFDDIKAHIETLEVIKSGDIEKMFGADFPSDLGIYKVSKKGGWKQNFNVLDKIMTKTKPAPIDTNMKNGWRVRISKIGGMMNTHRKSKTAANLGKLLYFYNGEKNGLPWYEFYGKNKWSKETPEITTSIKFNSEEECKNFINSLESTVLGRYVENELCKVTYINGKNILWLSDYTHSWNDEQLYAYFGLTSDEIDIIEKEMAKYE